MTDPTIRVFLLDDHEIVRRGVRDLLESEPGIEVVGEAGTAAQALERIALHRPDSAAVEETFVNANPQSTLKLGQARGVVLLVAAKCGLPVSEYAARLVKKAVVGTGAAEKRQVQDMVARLLPGVVFDNPDAADALAVAITHAHLGATAARVKMSLTA